LSTETLSPLSESALLAEFDEPHPVATRTNETSIAASAVGRRKRLVCVVFVGIDIW